MNLRYPNITGKTPEEQVNQIRSFLYNLVEELNLQESNDHAVTNQQNSVYATAPVSLSGDKEDSPAATFNKVKALIIKSADIINAYEAEIQKTFDGKYLAQSEFGVYERITQQSVTYNSRRINSAFTEIQRIQGEFERLLETQAYVRQGLLFTVGENEKLEEELGQDLPDGAGVYGVEVGQITTMDGVKVFNKFARFTAYGMTLYDDNGNMAAYITDSRLNIPHAVIKSSLTRGGFQETILADGSSVERWVGA